MKLHCKTTVVAGPPGTGKTTYLLELLEQLFNEGVNPSKVCFSTFTKSGSEEGKIRSMEKFPKLSTKDFKWFRTLHSLCYAFSPIKSMMKTKQEREFGKSLGLWFSYANPADGKVPITSRGDQLRHLLSLSRLTQRPLEEVFNEAELIGNISYPELLQFEKSYYSYMEANGLVDYTKTLEDFVKNKPPVPFEYMIVDEAQDLSILQWRVIEHISNYTKEIIIAGDDDQSIFKFSGASPDYMINLKNDEYIVLPKSYRIPECVHNISQSIISGVSNRLEKEFSPRDEKGEIEVINDIASMDMNVDESWLFLSRNNLFLDYFEQELKEKGLPYRINGRDETDLLERAIRAYRGIGDNGMVTGKELKTMITQMKVGSRIKMGMKQVINDLDDADMIMREELYTTYGFLQKGHWSMVFNGASEEDKYYYEEMEKMGYMDKDAYDIRLSTIHQSKGQEADNVVLLTDMTKRSYMGLKNDRDSELRLFYVAVTRAKKKLWLHNPITGMYFNEIQN